MVTAILLDTSAVIGLLERQLPSLRQLIEEQSLPIHVSVVTLGELHHGVEASTDALVRQRRRSSLETIRTLCDAVEVTAADALVYGDVSARLRKAGFEPRRVGTADRWISANAITRGLNLVTQDVVLAEALTSIGHGSQLTLCE